MPSPWKVSPSPSFSARISSVNCRSTHPRNKFVPPGGVLDHLGPIEGRAQHGGVGVLAAQAAADAAVYDRGDRVAAQRIRVVLDGEGGAARQADARVIAGARVFVHAVFHADGSLSLGKIFCDNRPQLTLAFELAFTFRDDDF